MTPSELAFLAVGLVVGSIGGGAWFLLRGQASRRSVRITVAPGAIPIRPMATLVSGVVADVGAGPARGGPADRGPGAPQNQTSVRLRPSTPSPVADATTFPATVRSDPAPSPVPVPGPAIEVLRASAALAAERAMRAPDSRAAVAVLERPAARHGASASATAGDQDMADDVAVGPPAPAQAGNGTERAGATADAGDPGDPAVSAADGGGPAGGTARIADDSCADPRRQVDERCAVADRARAEAARVADALHATQREYDQVDDRLAAAAAELDPRRIRQRKDAAQQAFHAARAAAGTRPEIEAAARDWLTEINRINVATRDATALREGTIAATHDLARRLEHQTVEADAARIAADVAQDACTTAREQLARCEEAGAADRVPPPSGPPPRATGSGDEAAAVELDGGLAGSEAAILRLLRGERPVLTGLATTLAGGDPDDARRWQLLLAELVDALVARAIEAVHLDFPEDHAFWGPFSQPEARDVAAALASLGYRFDGLGGWVDDRLPSQRDLSLAVGYAGLDPMRIRHWPTEAETEQLYGEVRVAADEYLVGAAGELALGDLVTILGRRADNLAELWNAWGRVRPLLLGPA